MKYTATPVRIRRPATGWRLLSWLAILGALGALGYWFYLSGFEAERLATGWSWDLDWAFDSGRDTSAFGFDLPRHIQVWADAVIRLYERAYDGAVALWWSLHAALPADIAGRPILLAMLLALGVLFVLLLLCALLWRANLHLQRRYHHALRRANHAETALTEIRALLTALAPLSLRPSGGHQRAIGGTLGDAIESVQNAIANWHTRVGAQRKEILSVTRAVSDMADAIGRSSTTASKTTARARNSAQGAQEAAAAVGETIAGMNTAREGITAAAGQLGGLGESVRRIGEIVSQIQDAAGQTGVWSINTAIHAPAAGRELMAATEEAQRLADRSARGAGEIADLARNMRRDTDSAIAMLKTATDATAAAEQAGKALTTIDTAGREFLDTIDMVAAEAVSEVAMAQTVGTSAERLTAVAEQSAAGIAEITAGVEKVHRVVTELVQSLASFQSPGRW